jgi:DNA-binding LytR/AlgR family response regulator
MEIISRNNVKNYLQSSRLLVSNNDGVFYLNVEDVLYAQNDNSYTKLFVKNNGGPIMVSQPLRKFESLLANAGFVRANQSVLVNLLHVNRLFKGVTGLLVQMPNGNSVSISRQQRPLFLESLKENSLLFDCDCSADSIQTEQHFAKTIQDSRMLEK